MISFSHKGLCTAGLIAICSGLAAQDVPPTEAAPPPVDPVAVPQLPPLDGSLPSSPAADGTSPTATALTPPVATIPFGAGATFPTGASAQFGGDLSAVPTPPPLTSLSAEASEATATDLGTTVSSTIAVETYQFLFREDPDLGVVRERYLDKAANDLKEKRIKELEEEYTRRLREPTGLGLGAGMLNPAGMDPLMIGDPSMQAGGFAQAGVPGQPGQMTPSNSARATAEWDFYYEQLDMYNKYVSNKLVPNAENVPELGYDPLNALEERRDLKTAYEEAAVTQVNDQYNENKDFYARLQNREDRRRAYYEWLLMTQQKVEDWTLIWARRTNGTRWADGEPVRRDDWYYGTDFNSADPVEITVDNRRYLVSKQPQSKLRPGELNVISSNLTPYDIIDANGEMKNPVMETLRGTVVIPPVEQPVLNTGTIEIVP